MDFVKKTLEQFAFRESALGRELKSQELYP